MLRTPAVGPGVPRRPALGGYTLMELLVVMVIIGTLAFIGYGIIQGVRQQASGAHARSDLALLVQALEQYRHQYGDYPQTSDTPEKLCQALAGKLGPTGAVLHNRSLLALVPVALKDPDQPEAAGNYFVDPWGHAYQYVFFTRQEGTGPVQRGYVLFSLGQRLLTETVPTRAQVVPATSGNRGGVISSDPINTPNIYAGL